MSAQPPPVVPVGDGARVWMMVTFDTHRIVRYGLEQNKGGTVKIQVLTRESERSVLWHLAEMELPAAEFQRFNQ